ncbi:MULTISPECIES: transaldolase [unclassified Oleiphilus]|jgi:transaldolase|uniref:transaldolase n=4 Tax=Oleiphilus TaxID=141450 RepID=UPI0007C34522|nr:MULTISPECIES: transaldolase [unclassified Oleiphilus]KZY40408.1 transaldolase [Oleiphilus sp. HI0050]KZY72737.1 transaldolase [Oleiphilus sp. HI0068]KZY88109.1 transaldolase [Oleiphilus sp. HI0072]KZY88447.1 transaldolase [Oleiphilus sp. HI0069]KZZ32236.1 transaldolase [Oleiphilus sp. HI0085]
MASKLEQLRQYTTVVADTGDIDAIKKWQPQDATTNPSLILKAAPLPQYRPLIDNAINYGSSQGKSDQEQLSLACDHLAVSIGTEISKVVPGRVSTEVDARLSFDTPATVAKAKSLIQLYEDSGVSKSRILIKIASTWEGIKAAEQLEKEGINCNLTLLFDFVQAKAAAESGAFLISPFVGRILDWYKANTDKDQYLPHEDPGVISVSEIYNYYKQHGFSTVVMGASFRNTDEIEQLAGCDRLTISPELLKQLSCDNGSLERKLIVPNSTSTQGLVTDQASFRWNMNQSPMATEKLAEGIRKFAIDQVALEGLLRDHPE